MSEAVMKRFLTSRRQDAFHHFSRMIGGEKCKSGDMSTPDDDVRVTRSSPPEVEDWAVDTDAANCSVTDTRRLDRYSLEYIFTLPRHSSLLLLVRVSDDRALFDGKATKVDALQNVPRKTICGDQYYQLRCRLSDTFHNDPREEIVISSVLRARNALREGKVPAFDRVRPLRKEGPVDCPEAAGVRERNEGVPANRRR